MYALSFDMNIADLKEHYGEQYNALTTTSSARWLNMDSTGFKAAPI